MTTNMKMSRKDIAGMAFKNLWKRKMRTFLTILGVIIGTSAIIVMLSLGIGMKDAFTKEIESLGSLTVITVYSGYYDPYDPGPMATTLNNESIETFSKMKGVEAVTPILETDATMVTGRYSSYVQVRGIDPKTMDKFDFKLAEGRLLEPGDDIEAVFGGEVKQHFMDPRRYNVYEDEQDLDIDLINDRLILTFDWEYGEKQLPEIEGMEEETTNKINYKSYPVKGVGILDEEDYDNAYYVYMPIDEVKKLMKEKTKVDEYADPKAARGNQYESALIKVTNMEDVENIRKSISEMGYEAYSLTEYLESMQQTANIIQAVLGGIGAVSLLVAAIGITNTMVMSIYERTKEIGIMKVIGASLTDIKKLFLFEAGTIGLIGGIIGILFSLLISFILNNIGMNFVDDYMGFTDVNISVIPIWLVIAAATFSTLIGIISGYYPAKRATKLSPLEAMKNE